jgi:hypothetical protein
MKNNTAYLKNIHLALLLAVAYGLIAIYLSPYIYELFGTANRIYSSIILSALYTAIIYAGIAVVTSKWKELLIAFILAEAIFVGYLLFEVKDSNNGGYGYGPIIYFFAVPIPLTIFICLQIGWNRQIIWVYLGVLLATLVLLMTSIEDGQFFRLTSFVRSGHYIWYDLLRLFFFIATRLFQVIFICELLNWLRSDSKKPKTLLLNLGNEYGRFNGFIAFWVMKTSLLLLAVGTANYLKILMEAFTYKYGKYDGTDGYRIYIMIIGFVSIVGAILLALFAAWYLRRLLLEYFITYNVQSKFLYWLALIPFIGFLSFLFMETSQNKEQNYNEKVASIGNFAASSTTAISIIAFTGMFLRLIFRISNIEGSVVLSIVLACLLFTWMIYSPAAYYINGVVILLALAAILVYTFMGRYVIEELIAFFGLLVVALAQLVLFLPVYHFDKFFYTPSQNPEPEPGQPRDIFA